MNKLFKKDSGEEHNFWMSYTDLMSGFLIVFIVVSAVLFNYVSEKTKELDEAALKYNQARTELEKASHNNDELKAKVDSLNQKDMKNLIAEYEDLAGIKGDINVVVNKSKGSIALYHKNNEELFGKGEDKPLKALKEFLNEYGKGIIAKTMKLKQKYPNIELRIEGHTDPDGQYGQEYGGDASFVYNMGLSSKRANSIYSYLYNSQKVSLNEQEKAFLRNNAISVGYSFSERIKNGTHSNRIAYEYLDDASRRIEFRIIAK